MFATSGTLDAVDSAGREREHNYQKVLKALELRRDIEKAIGDTDVARDGSDPRKSASLTCWMSNGSVGATGAFAVGADGTTTITSGTARALTLALIEDGMQDAWTDGGNPRLMIASATNRANFSDLSASGNLVSNDVNMTAAKEVTYVGSTSVFLTDFGTVEAVPSRLLGNDRVFLLTQTSCQSAHSTDVTSLSRSFLRTVTQKRHTSSLNGRLSLPRLRHTQLSTILTDHNKSEGAGDCPLSSMRETT